MVWRAHFSSDSIKNQNHLYRMSSETATSGEMEYNETSVPTGQLTEMLNSYGIFLVTKNHQTINKTVKTLLILNLGINVSYTMYLRKMIKKQ